MAKNLNHNQPTLATGLAIAIGEFKDTSAIDKFGMNPSVGTAAFEVVSDLGTSTYPSTATTLTVTSQAGTPADDNGVEITLVGLDENYEDVSASVTLAGAGTATTTQTFIRVFRAFVINGQDPTDDLLIEASDGTDLAQITHPYNQTLMAQYTIPAGKTGYLLSGNLSTKKDKDVEAKLMFRELNGNFQTKGLVLTPGEPFQRTWTVPLSIPAKTDIEIRAKAGAAGPVAAGFEIILVDA